MSATDTLIDRSSALEAKIDALTAQVALLTEEAAIRRRQRESFDELRHDLAPIAEDAMALATRELAELDESVDLADLVRLSRRLLEAAPTLERALVGLDQLAELADDVAPLGGDMMALLTERLAQAEERGYFSFAQAGLGVVDRVVTGFSEEDVAQLGENVVTILETVKEITRPEMLTLLGQMIGALEHQRQAVELEPAEAPGLWALARQLRDPDVRRGMARALATLRSVSADTSPGNSSPDSSQSEQ